MNKRLRTLTTEELRDFVMYSAHKWRAFDELLGVSEADAYGTALGKAIHGAKYQKTIPPMKRKECLSHLETLSDEQIDNLFKENVDIMNEEDD